MLEGFHALKHALRFGAVVEEALSPDPAEVARLAREMAPDLVDRLLGLVRPVTSEELKGLAGMPVGTGVVALARRPAQDAAALAQVAGPIVLLDRPSHLGNVGAVVRVAAAAEAGAVVTTGPLDPWHPAALRGSAGLHFALPVMALEALPEIGREIVALDPEGEPAWDLELGPGIILAFGNERGGLSPELRALAGRRLAIPMRAGVSSLNLATAVAVTLYGLKRPGPPEPRQRSTIP